MRVSINFALPLLAVLFELLLIPWPALAQVSNCPVEPAVNVPIADGGIFTGANCNLYTDGDVDSFVFNGTAGDTYQLAVAIDGVAPTNVCLTLRNPSLNVIYGPACTYLGETYSVVTDQKLAATGSYTIDITEPSTGTVNYAVSLERLYPFPPNAQQVGFAKVVASEIAELTDSNAFTFSVDTTGEYQVTATLTGSPSYNLCMTVYEPGGATAGSGCTYLGETYTVQIAFKPTQPGTSMAFLYVGGNDGTATYSLEVSCVAGTCPIVYPPCTLTDSATYDAASSTLTMNFTVGNKYAAATWNAWLTYQNSMTSLFSVSQPITAGPGSPVATPKTASLSPEGTVGVLSTLTTPTKGIVCSSWTRAETAAP